MEERQWVSSSNYPISRSQTCMCLLAIGILAGSYCPDICWQQRSIRTTSRWCLLRNLGYGPRRTSENSWQVHVVHSSKQHLKECQNGMCDRSSKRGYHEPRCMVSAEKKWDTTLWSRISSNMDRSASTAFRDVRDRETERCEISACQNVIVSRAVQSKQGCNGGRAASVAAYRARKCQA